MMDSQKPIPLLRPLVYSERPVESQIAQLRWLRTNIFFLLALFIIIREWLTMQKRNENWHSSLYRDVKSQGLWCSVLFPICLFSHQLQTPDTATEQDEMFALLLLSSIPLSLAVHLNNNRENSVIEKKYQSIIMLILICLIGLPWLLSNRFAYGQEVVFVIVGLVVYYKMIGIIPERFPKSFTAGESFAVCQIMLWFTFKFFKLAYKLPTSDYSSVNKEYVFGMVAVEAVLLCVILFYLIGNSSTKMFYFLYGSVGFVFVVPILYLILRRNPLIWLLIYLKKEPHRDSSELKHVVTKICFAGRIGPSEGATQIPLFIYWLVCTFLAVLIVSLHNLYKRNTSTSTRKYFHFLILAVYIPGLQIDPEFLKMSSFIVLGVLLLFEHIRVNNIPPLASVLQDAFQTFTDEKDSGNLILTHIYLLVGCSLPLWIVEHVKGRDITMYSGLLSVGIGDTAASLFGSTLGKFHISDSKKTVEGTLCSIVFQIVFLMVFIYFSLLDDTVSLVRLLIAIVLTSLLEACIEQIDNLILPMFMFFIIR